MFLQGSRENGEKIDVEVETAHQLWRAYNSAWKTTGTVFLDSRASLWSNYQLWILSLFAKSTFPCGIYVHHLMMTAEHSEDTATNRTSRFNRRDSAT